MTRLPRFLFLGLLTTAAPVSAQTAGSDPLAPLPSAGAQRSAPPAPSTAALPPAPASVASAPSPVPSSVVRIPSDWRGVFSAIRRGEWAAANAGVASLPQSPLTSLAKAQLFTAKGSPTVSLDALQQLLAQAPELPQADQLARMAVKRGAATPPLIMLKRPVVYIPGSQSRYRATPVSGDPYAPQLRAQLEPLVKANDAASAEALLNQTGALMGYDARAEAGQRVAWVYYVLGDDLNARRVADTWRPGASGEWLSQAAWISGLASWRLNDCEAASRSFREVAASAVQREMRAAGYYWAARAEHMCRRPRSVAPLLKLAAGNPESFYGLIARETLGLDTHLPPAPLQSTAAIDNLPNIRRANELLRIGERRLAEELIRHQAAIGNVQDHRALIEFARRNELASLQHWLANHGQRGAVVYPADRYPNPKWSPITGWRVDPALAFGHIVQESTFITDAVSGAGAVGLMQVRPGTAEDEARTRGIAYSRGALTDPKYNLEFGQSFIERMRRSTLTGGQLPKIIASYNAGPTPLGRWASINDKGDPLLWIESLSYWETRYYVPAVLRNMWVYQGLNRTPTPTLKAIAEHHWPAFPTGQTRLAH
ncbi:transglycosylase SLT domain-containing protein [Sphingomonas piscis]|uniref:Transglycosylase SLT domain-containing protein n=1 Tax=Sphingomonas piscis TaxID=2714943 RepID=A0A6G7YLJ4_9SPHN|nr:lytic transglycosylase domain-containing protein [Sphingomonas piscis]QIK77615.1 transglycosylase SLT domain-containing protein [Sphingomonas piscis]